MIPGKSLVEEHYMLQLLAISSIIKYILKLKVWKAFTSVHNPKLSSANILALKALLDHKSIIREPLLRSVIKLRSLVVQQYT